MRTQTRSLFLGILILVLGACRIHAATVMNFDAFQRNATSNDFGAYDWGTSITLNGFTIASTPNPGGTFSALSTLGPLNPAYIGEPVLYNRQSAGGLVLTKTDGGTFSLLSIDLVELPAGDTRFGGPWVHSPSGTFDITFFGNQADGSTLVETATVTDFETDPHLQTFTFSGFTNLISVDWRQGDGNIFQNDGTYVGDATHQFDNIVVDTAPVPEPTSVVAWSLVAVFFAAGLLRPMPHR